MTPSWWILCEASSLRVDHVVQTARISVRTVDHSGVAPTALRRKCNDRNTSGLGGRRLLVTGREGRDAFGALIQTVAFGIVNLLGDDTATDAAAV